MSQKRIGIIGAGASGLLGIKTCLEYGLEPVCFEKYHEIGGLWNYKEDSSFGDASVMKSTIINTSKECMAFSDFPAPEHFPNYMHNSWIMDYFRLYADHFGLMPHIQFNTSVKLVQRASDHEETGAWEIEYRGKDDSESKIERFDGILICTGHHAYPFSAEIEGLDKFKGTVTHSSLYKTSKPFEDRKVLVVGIGNSGGDIAVELGRNGVSPQVYLVARRGTWILHRVGKNGIPGDLFFHRRIQQYLTKTFPGLINTLLEKQLNQLCDHEAYGLKAKHRPLQQHPFAQDDLPNRILSGTVKIKPEIVRFTETGALFEDGTKEEFDDVIMCTGYTIGYPFLEEGVIPVKENQLSLFKYMYQPNLAHVETMAVIGLIQPYGAIMPIAELQCRLFAEAFTKQISLPSEAQMVGDILDKRETMAKRYVACRRHTIQVDWLPFMDELAKLAGVMPPNSFDIAFSDPKLALHLAFGPIMPYAYRLVGPHAWPKARDTLLTVWDRVYAPTKSKLALTSKKTSFMDTGLAKLIMVAIVAYLFYCWLHL